MSECSFHLTHLWSESVFIVNKISPSHNPELFSTGGHGISSEFAD